MGSSPTYCFMCGKVMTAKPKNSAGLCQICYWLLSLKRELKKEMIKAPNGQQKDIYLQRRRIEEIIILRDRKFQRLRKKLEGV